MPKQKDVYPQFMFLDVTMSAANTLTFGRVAVGGGLFEYAAFIVSRIEWQVANASILELLTDTDIMWAALTGSATLDDINRNRSQVYDQIEVFTQTRGTATSFEKWVMPIVHDFSNMDGGGLLLPAQDFFIAMGSVGFASAGSVNCRVYYRVIELVAADYLELSQRLRVLST